MCRRKTKDPLLRYVAERGYTMLKNPRTGVEPGQAWIRLAERFDPLDHVERVCTPALKLPPPTDETLLGLQSRESRAFDTALALGVLGPALAAIGMPPLLVDGNAHIEAGGETSLKVQLTDVVERSIPFGVLAAELRTRKVKPALRKSQGPTPAIVVAAAVLCTGGFVVAATKKKGGALKLSVDAKLASAGVGVAVARVSESQLSFTSTKRLVIGVRPYQFAYDAAGWIGLAGFDGRNAVLGEGDHGLPDVPVLLGGRNGELFVDFGDGPARAGRPATV